MFGLAICYGGIAQLLAGMGEFTKGNTFGATAFSSFGSASATTTPRPAW
ncbi:GPR1/FUN34/YaaH family transporter [uncultured Jatrophihabitans sp.]